MRWRFCSRSVDRSALLGCGSGVPISFRHCGSHLLRPALRSDHDGGYAGSPCSKEWVVSIAPKTLGPEQLRDSLNVIVIFRQHHSSPSRSVIPLTCVASTRCCEERKSFLSINRQRVGAPKCVLGGQRARSAPAWKKRTGSEQNGVRALMPDLEHGRDARLVPGRLVLLIAVMESTNVSRRANPARASRSSCRRVPLS
jgi:hypothetical protein